MENNSAYNSSIISKLGKVDILIIGAGINGLSTAYNLQKQNSDLSILVVEKGLKNGEEKMSSTKRNTGTGHSGAYYKPLTARAILNNAGFTLLQDYCKEKSIPITKTGKTIIGFNTKQDYLTLQKYKNNVIQNGRPPKCVSYCDSTNQILDREPLLSPKVTQALFLEEPYTFLADQVLNALEDDVVRMGGKVLHGFEVRSVKSEGNDRVWVVEGNEGLSFRTRFICNNAASGMYDIARMMGGAKDWYTTPVIGVYKEIQNNTPYQIKSSVYQISSNPNMPFLGPHAMESDGKIHFGPTAISAFGMRDYFGGIPKMKHLKEGWKAHFTTAELWKFYLRNVESIPTMVSRHFLAPVFAKACQRMINPELFKIDPSKLVNWKIGSRTQKLENGKISQEFQLEGHNFPNSNQLGAISNTNPGIIFFLSFP
jgi:L-2-hydroxyglutarate oxidase LhgO